MRVLVVMIESRGAEALVAEARAAADGQHPITLLQLCDPQFNDRVCSKLREDGWLGAARSHQVSEALSEDYRARFERVLTTAVETLEADGLSVRCVSRVGDLVNMTLRVAEEEGDVGMILVGRPRTSWFTRWFKEVNERVLADRATCAVRYVTLAG